MLLSMSSAVIGSRTGGPANGRCGDQRLLVFRKTVKGENSIPPAFVGGANAEADVRLTEDSLGVGYACRF